MLKGATERDVVTGEQDLGAEQQTGRATSVTGRGDHEQIATQRNRLMDRPFDLTRLGANILVSVAYALSV